MWERGKNPGVQPCVGPPALGEVCLQLGGVCGAAQCWLSAFKHKPGPSFIFHLLPESLICISFPFFVLFFFFPFFSWLFFPPLFLIFSLTESSIEESQSFIMTEAEPGICVKGLRKQNEGWPELGACVRWVWRRDGKDG